MFDFTMKLFEFMLEEMRMTLPANHSTR
jgi:hypothetical protein